MLRIRSFHPDWAIPPGATIADRLQRMHLSMDGFATRLGKSEDQVMGLITGDTRITAEMAGRLELILGGSASYWLRRDSRYVEAVHRIRPKEEMESAREWLRQLPIADMTRFGWIGAHNNVVAQARQCLNFFGIKNFDELTHTYWRLGETAAFRTSATFESRPGSVAAWLRKGEIEAAKIQCAPWNPTAFKAEVVALRQLSRIRSPDIFLPQLIERCAKCGVAVVIVRTPSGCHASGATRFLGNGKAILLLSFRYKTDDHFWFSFFHEAAHLILHGESAFFVEGAGVMTTKEEAEANSFAAQILIPEAFERQLMELGRNYRAIVRFARRIGIAPGIVVGQLQHRNKISHKHMNFLKTRYVWEVDRSN